jgi:hypothetical protein
VEFILPLFLSGMTLTRTLLRLSRSFIIMTSSEELVVFSGHGKQKRHFRMIAYHTPATDLIPSPTEEIRQHIFATYTDKDKAPPIYIDLAIGTRVSCTKNLGTQIGDLRILTYTIIVKQIPNMRLTSLKITLRNL